MNRGFCLVAFAALGLSASGLASAQTSNCSSTGGYPEGSPGALMAGLRGLSSGAYAACVEAQRRNAPANSESWQARAVIARNAVSTQLSQPLTAQFRNVRRRYENGVLTFCGEVSGENRYARRSAFVRFHAAVPDRGEAFSILDTEDGLLGRHFDAAWSNYCGPGGTPTAF